MKYQVISGIFEGTIFNGCVQSNRVLNTDTIGQSYPIENCIKIEDFKNIKRVEEIKKQLISLKIKVTIENICAQSLFSIGGTLTDKKNIFECLAILEAKVYDTPENVKSLDNCYFTQSYNLKKEDCYNSLQEALKWKLDLQNKRITPSSLIGRGYNDARKCAFNWINKQIFKSYYLYYNFDFKNKTSNN